MRRLKIFFPLFTIVVELCVSILAFSQKKDFEWSRIPQDTTIVSEVDATETLHTPDGEKTIHYIDGKRIATERRRTIIIIAASLLLLGFILWAISFYRKKERETASLNEALSSARNEVDSLESDLCLIRHHSDSLSETVANLLENQVTIVRTIIDKHDSLSQSPKGTFFDKYEALQDKVDKYNDYLEHLRKDVDLVGSFEEALDSTNDGIMRKLRGTLGEKFSEEDYRILSCIFVGMQPGSISFVTGIPSGTIRTRKNRYKNRLEALPDSAEKRLFLSFWKK